MPFSGSISKFVRLLVRRTRTRLVFFATAGGGTREYCNDFVLLTIFTFRIIGESFNFCRILRWFVESFWRPNDRRTGHGSRSSPHHRARCIMICNIVPRFVRTIIAVILPFQSYDNKKKSIQKITIF